MSKISFNSIPASVFSVNASDTADKNQSRADIVSAGRVLAYEYAAKGKKAINAARGFGEDPMTQLNAMQYKQLNEKFQADHLLYAAKKVCANNDMPAPSTMEEFRKHGMEFYGNAAFYAVLQGIYQEIITPILPAIYSEAVDEFAEVVEVGFGETYALSIDSNDIPIFQDSSWGASRSVPRNRFYAADYTLNPTPRSAWVTAKWTQLVGNNMDFGRFFANIAAGMYAKTMALWNSAMTEAVADPALVPQGLTYTFNNENWVAAANKIAALNNTSISNVFATGNAVALSKVLPTDVTGSTNINMDAAIATLLGADYTRAGYLGEFMSVRLMPMRDVVVPGTQNGDVQTVLNPDLIYMMAGNGRKPLTIAYNSGTPITIEMDPRRSADFEIGINMTIALDSLATFASRIAVFNI